MRRFGALALALALALGAAPAQSPAQASAQASTRAPAQASDNAPSGPPVVAPDVVTRVPEHPVTFAELPPPRRFVTHHETTIRGQRIRYTATAGETYITNLSGQPIASFFSFAYVKDGPRDPSRPVLFVFNGGPGSASIWLHLGVIGPRRVALDRDVNPSSVPPFRLEDNPDSPLDVADLVFIDPVGTGFSHAIGNAVDADFFGVDEDADSVARFIEAWLTENGRWNSPKYLMGESYGSVRAAILPRALMGAPLYTGVMRGITVNGVILLGVTLDGPGGGDEARRVGQSLPAFAATAWYHNRIDRAGRSVEQLHAEVAAFAAGDYAEAVRQVKAGTLGAAEKAAIAARLAGYTGIPAQAWIARDLQLSTRDFLRMLLADHGLEAGSYDSRYTLPLAGSGNDPVADDPAMGRYVPGFVAAFHDLLRDELQVAMPIPYDSIRWASLNFTWRWHRLGPPVARDFAGELAVAMRRNPDLRVLAASGYYDLVTTAAAAERQLRGAGLPAERLAIRNYESGHMLYLGGTAARFADDVRALILNGRGSEGSEGLARPRPPR